MSRKLLTLLPACLSAVICFSQSHPELVKAELAFAGTAKTVSTKTAFLQYMDSAAVVFNRGEILNGMRFWQESKEDKSKLLWHPTFFAMSAAGDFGFTTGPWEYRPSLEDSVAGSGQYTTVWTKNKKGEWKFLADLGVSYRPNLFGQPVIKKFAAFTSAKGPVDILSIENDFINSFTEKGNEAYRDVLMEHAWLNIDRKHPIQTAVLILDELSTLPKDMVFTPVAGAVAASRDMAYVYGTIRYKSKTENYLRVWVHEKRGWRVLLQVIKR